ncbi:transcriptional repressor LexA [Pseudemcibacter aquimaris]|uniref:transcriptional repressor LexA n=1 Tax=Pseudemcibacter aquimaris TaxID=2857064 RepID=UPI00201290EF|nr:transcriptional repressor LexA [Pseudemcibacter aquimaris]MCC3861018.1 transcriptional repressor LexA [Pseudemcibacter aquimaris]WDU59836.1 transcriptional repressor LexA [Pseudemcibacter aquimaris]
MLTKKQHTLLMLIHDKLHEDGIAPSFEEMKVALDLKSKSGIHRLINALEERGFIRRLPNRARALEVIKLPDDEENVSQESNLFKPDFGNKGGNVDPQTTEIPLHGKIAAGTPIEALEQYENIGVPAAMLGAGSYYALDVDGDSMIEAGILDGDRVVIERCDNARTGEIVVALVDEEEATLKTLQKRGPDVALEPSNRDFETQVYPANRVRIQGKLVGLIRQY